MGMDLVGAVALFFAPSNLPHPPTHAQQHQQTGLDGGGRGSAACNHTSIGNHHQARGGGRGGGKGALHPPLPCCCTDGGRLLFPRTVRVRTGHAHVLTFKHLHALSLIALRLRLDTTSQNDDAPIVSVPHTTSMYLYLTFYTLTNQQAPPHICRHRGRGPRAGSDASPPLCVGRKDKEVCLFVWRDV